MRVSFVTDLLFIFYKYIMYGNMITNLKILI